MTEYKIPQKTEDDISYQKVGVSALVESGDGVQPMAVSTENQLVLDYLFGDKVRIMRSTKSLEKKEWWELLKNKYRSRVYSATSVGLIGVSDLMLYLLGSEPYLHWYTDLLLIVGSIGLLIVVSIKALEEAGEI